MTTIFTPCRKMADLITDCHKIILLLPRFGIKLGFGDKSVHEVCRQYGVNENLFLIICNVYAVHDYQIEPEMLISVPIDELISYLRLSHRYYLQERVPHIEQHLYHLADSENEKARVVLKRFFTDYKEEVVGHFEFEEKTVFPYAESLTKRDRGSQNFSILSYEKNHSNIEDKLDDLTSIIIKYLPGDTLPEERTSVLFDLFQLSSDLRLHNKLEEHLFVPLVEKIENNK